MTDAFWQGRRVFLTGHTGFKGSWLTLMLQVLGAQVHGFALPPATTPSLFHDACVADGITSRFGDIRDEHQVRQALQQAKPEIVLHLAAQAIVSSSYDKPLETWQSNVLGTANVLEAVRQQSGVKAVILVTSDKCYDNREWLWSYRENEPLGGNDPYSASKAGAELVAASYRYAFFDRPEQPAIATARAGNVIGGGDWSRDRLIPDMMRAFARGETVLLRNPEAVRPWQHVLEPLWGYLLLARQCFEDRSNGQAWNFGPDQADAQPVRYIADALTQLWGQGASWRYPGQNTVKEAHLLKLDSTKARTLLRWQPVTTLDDALQLTAEWYKAYAQGTDARSLTEQQIRAFFARS